MKARPGEFGLSRAGTNCTRDVRIVQKGHLRIAVPVEDGPLLDEATVEAVVRKLRGRGLR